MKNFNLMQIVPNLRSGGVEQGTIDVANYLGSFEIKNYICSNGGHMVSYLNKDFVQHLSINVNSKNFLKMPFIAKKINLILEKQKIDILHFRSRGPAWLLPYLKIKNLKTVSTFHNVYGGENFFKKIYNKQLGNVNKIITISNYVKDEIIKKYNINPNKVSVINRGVDTNFFDSENINKNDLNNFLTKHNIELNKKIVLFPGRLTGWKGQIEFLKIIEKFRDQPICFYFVGDDKNISYLHNLNKQIIKKNLNTQCRILGHMEKQELKMMYYSSSIIISAPLRPEGFGRIISESLAMKKIILAYNFGGAKDQLNQLDSIYKVENQSDKEMISKIQLILNLDNNQITNLGNNARNHIVNNYSKINMQKSYLSFYQGL